jgi:hypothetical protein
VISRAGDGEEGYKEGHYEEILLDCTWREKREYVEDVKHSVFFFSSLISLLAYINCMKSFHYDISIYAYNVL